ncbi:MAG: hypothetical protein ABR549_03045 [Mycobacteriales bacterium]
MTAAALTQVVLKRQASTWRDKSRAYKVLLDGAVVGVIRDGQSLNVQTTPGRHHLRLKMDWLESQSLELKLEQGELRAFTCGPNGRALSALFDLFSRKRFWIKLQDGESP